MVLRKTVIISIITDNDLKSNENKTQKLINVNFVPDEVILRSVAVMTNAAAGDIFLVKTDLVDSNMLCCLSAPATGTVLLQNMENHYMLNKAVNGYFYFQLTDLFGAIPQITSNVALALTFEFVKY